MAATVFHGQINGRERSILDDNLNKKTVTVM